MAIVEGLLLRVPYLRGLYSTLKELGEAILSERKNALQRVVLVEYPNPGIYAIGFLTAEPRRFSDPGRKPLAAVFIPTVPNPTTGLVLFYPEEALIPTSVTVEQAIKMVISGGVVTPERIAARRSGGGTTGVGGQRERPGGEAGAEPSGA